MISNYININNRHTFHSECIKKWLDKKIICPLCRVELRAELFSQNNHSNYIPPGGNMPNANNTNNTNNNSNLIRENNNMNA